MALRRYESSRSARSSIRTTPATQEIDWGRVLDNFGPEGVVALIEQLGFSAPAEFAA